MIQQTKFAYSIVLLCSIFLGFQAPLAHAATRSVREDIIDLANEIRIETPRSTASASQLVRARSQLEAALDLITQTGGGGGTFDVQCNRVNGLDYYAPARVSDGMWLQDYATDSAQCLAQVRASQYDLVCSRISATDYYAPKQISSGAWRQDYGTLFETCRQQTQGAQRDRYCRRIQSSEYYAAASTSTGAWLESIGSALEVCLMNLPAQSTEAPPLPKSLISAKAPAVPPAAPATRE